MASSVLWASLKIITRSSLGTLAKAPGLLAVCELSFVGMLSAKLFVSHSDGFSSMLFEAMFSELSSLIRFSGREQSGGDEKNEPIRQKDFNLAKKEADCSVVPDASPVSIAERSEVSSEI